MNAFFRFLLFALPVGLLTSCSTYVKVVGLQSVHPAVKGDYILAGVRPGGHELLLSKQQYTGLYLAGVKNGKIKTLTERTGAGYQPAFSPDGKQLCYRSDHYDETKRLSSLYKIALETSKTTPLVENERVVSPPTVVGKDIAYTVEGKLKTTSFGWKIPGMRIEKTFVLTDDLEPMLYQDGYRRLFKPNGDGSYLWISLSPDRKKLLYYLVGKGSYVCDLYGENIIFAGDLMFPKWLNNRYIAGIRDRGESKTATDLVAINLKSGKQTVLTNTAQVNERNPHPFDKGRHIAYQTTAGEFKILKIKLR